MPSVKIGATGAKIASRRSRIVGVTLWPQENLSGDVQCPKCRTNTSQSAELGLCVCVCVCVCVGCTSIW